MVSNNEVESTIMYFFSYMSIIIKRMVVIFVVVFNLLHLYTRMLLSYSFNL